jgi:hypothetical protein
MNKIKIMLLSMLVFAVAGGAMAFNIKTITKFCTVTPNPDNTCPATPTCALTPGTYKTTTGTGVSVCYTTNLGIWGDCTGVTDCTTFAKITID